MVISPSDINSYSSMHMVISTDDINRYRVNKKISDASIANIFENKNALFEKTR